MKKQSNKTLENKKIKKEFDSPYTWKNAVSKGDVKTKVSILFMGFGNICHKQFIKGALFFLSEVAYILFMLQFGVNNLSKLPSLGSKAQTEVWNDKLGVYEYSVGDNSLLLLLFGIATLFLTIFFLLLWKKSVESSYKSQLLKEKGKHLNTFREDLADLLDVNLHKLLLTFPLMGILTFTILPLVFMMSMAFTNYSKENDHLILFHWVGFQNFVRVLNFSGTLGKTFWSVLVWTIVWAIFATFLNYIFGMILALVINRPQTHAKGFYRFCFILSIAVPQFVSLLIMRTMLQPQGAVNVLLHNMGVIDKSLPFFTNTMWARVTVIVINLWVGIPYTMMQVTGILKNIPGELYEAAKIDGATSIQTFWKITLPYMLFVTTPYLITSFTGNINNFNVIYLLSGGDPTPVGYTAGKTDLLITWLYKLTIDKKFYDIGAVIGILTFVVLAIVALITYQNTASYKDEEGFQ